jgi:nucleotide-binding universal stress UspA family protein
MVVMFHQAILKRIFLVVGTSSLMRYTVTLTVWLAREFKASVVIAHVAEPSENTHRGLQMLGIGQNEGRRERMEEIRRVKSQIAGAAIEVKTIYREVSRTSAELSRLAVQRRADLIIAESMGEIGGAAEGLIGKSHCPVLMVGPRADGEQGGRHALRSIVFLTHRSRASIVGAGYVFSLAKAFEARLLVVLCESAEDDLSESEFLEQASAAVTGVNWGSWKCAGEPAQSSALVDTLACVDHVQANLAVVNGQMTLGWEREKVLTLHELVQQAACPVMTLPWGR